MGHERSSISYRRRLTAPAPLAVLVLALGSLAGCGAAVAVVPAATVAPFPGNRPSPLVVDAAWLRAQTASDSKLLILDVSDRRTYRRGHVPGAVHAWWQDTMDRFYPVYGVALSDRQERDARTNWLASLGVEPGTRVVVYDNARNRYAAHLVWLLRYLGHDRAAVLDGGLGAWRGAGGEVERQAHEPRPVARIDVAARRGFIIGTTELRERLNDPALVILDVRTDAEARDDLNGALRRGRIPGAVSLPWTATVRDEAGRLRSPQELSTLLRRAGVTPEREVVVYARFGVEASQPWLVLKLLGYPKVRVYDQGWAEWAAKSDTPIAT